MIDEPLDRCVCTGLAGFVFEGKTGESRTVAVGCSTCGIRTESFPFDLADDAVLAWEAGDFADDVPTVMGGNTRSQPGSVSPGRLRGLKPVDLRG
jgi:hypothetical protein